VAAPANLHYLRYEGGPLSRWPCDPALASIAEQIAERRPELVSGTDRSSGLPYDTTPMLARAHRAISLSVQNGAIPNYHWPTDMPENLDPKVLVRAIEVAREMIEAIDRGEADV
jgi:hypothetical protein